MCVIWSNSRYITPLGNYDVPTGWPMKPYKRPYGGTQGPPVMYEKPSDLEDEGAGYGYSNAERIQEKDVCIKRMRRLISKAQWLKKLRRAERADYLCNVDIRHKR